MVPRDAGEEGGVPPGLLGLSDVRDCSPRPVTLWGLRVLRWLCGQKVPCIFRLVPGERLPDWPPVS